MPGQTTTVNHQSGKEYGKQLAAIERDIDRINEQFMDDDNYREVEELEERLAHFKSKFIECDRDLSGDLDMMDLKYMLEKLGQPKTHLELKKMIREVDTNNSGTINYNEFVLMMLGKSSVLQKILLFEERMKEPERPTSVAPKRSLADLP